MNYLQQQEEELRKKMEFRNRKQQEFERLRGTYPENVGIYIGYNNELAHKIYAGSDLFLMPSLFEPCGIGQMIAQRYGTLPIVRRTGGLKDSVIGYDGYNLDKANGFGFDDFNAQALINTCDWILNVYDNSACKGTHFYQICK